MFFTRSKKRNLYCLSGMLFAEKLTRLYLNSGSGPYSQFVITEETPGHQMPPALLDLKLKSHLDLDLKASSFHFILAYNGLGLCVFSNLARQRDRSDLNSEI